MRFEFDLQAAPQGSKTFMRGHIVESCKRVKPYRKALTRLVVEEKGGIAKIEGPVQVHACFVFERPKSHRKDSYPVTRSSGDIDKLLRATFDALTDAGVWGDDSQVTTVTASKVYGDACKVILSIDPDIRF